MDDVYVVVSLLAFGSLLFCLCCYKISNLLYMLYHIDDQEPDPNDADGLVVFAEGDPLVPRRVVEPYLPTGSAVKVCRTGRGGHLGFPANLDLGMGTELGLHGQLRGFWEKLR